MAGNEEWKARVDEVFAGKDLRGLFHAAGSPAGLGRDDAIYRESYLARRLVNRASDFTRLARETDPGDLSELESINRTMVLAEVCELRIEHLDNVAAISSPRLAKEEQARLEAEVSEAFGGKTASQAAVDAGQRLDAYERAAQAGPSQGTAAYQAFAGLGQVQPGKAESSAGATTDGSKPAAHVQRKDPQGPVVEG